MIGNKKNIRKGDDYNRFFDKSTGKVVFEKTAATVPDTINYILNRAIDTKYQTKKIAQILKGPNITATCRNIYRFLYQHIQYEKDAENYEEVRDPVRTWADKKADCDCFTLFISSILHNLNIPHKYRITSYGERNTIQNGTIELIPEQWEHIYVVVPNKTENIIIDCVLDEFNYEVEFHRKKDYEAAGEKKDLKTEIKDTAPLGASPEVIAMGVKAAADIMSIQMKVAGAIIGKIKRRRADHVFNSLKKWDEGFLPKIEVCFYAAAVAGKDDMKMRLQEFLFDYSQEKRYAVEAFALKGARKKFFNNWAHTRINYNFRGKYGQHQIGLNRYVDNFTREAARYLKKPFSKIRDEYRRYIYKSSEEKRRREALGEFGRAAEDFQKMYEKIPKKTKQMMAMGGVSLLALLFI